MKQSLLSRHRFLILFAFLFALASLALGAETDSAVLVVRGEVDKPLQLTLADLRAMPRSTVKAREKDGTEATFEGVALAELIKGANPKLTEKCCGNAANTCVIVIVQATDNYRVIFGKPLAESQGPLRLIVPGEKVHARWVRQVRTLEILQIGANTKP